MRIRGQNQFAAVTAPGPRTGAPARFPLRPPRYALIPIRDRPRRALPAPNDLARPQTYTRRAAARRRSRQQLLEVLTRCVAALPNVCYVRLYESNSNDTARRGSRLRFERGISPNGARQR